MAGGNQPELFDNFSKQGKDLNLICKILWYQLLLTHLFMFEFVVATQRHWLSGQTSSYNEKAGSTCSSSTSI